MYMRRIFLSILLGLLASTSALADGRVFTLKNSADGRSTLQVFLPDEAKATGRVIVCCPGGGYSNLSLQNEGADWVPFFMERGDAFCILTYRMPKGDRTIPMGDAMQAIRTVRDSADAWHLNPQDVGIMGFSAGGHLASTVATHSEPDARPDFQILFYPVISMVEKDSHRGSVVNFLGEGREDKQLQKEFSNDKQVRSHQTPPAILLMANNDFTVPVLTNGLRYYEALLKKGVSATMHVYPSGGHGFGFKTSFAYHDLMLHDLSVWLDHLKMPRKGATRVACIGNSITDGHGLNMRTEQGYPALLQHFLGRDYNVKNFGVSARTMLNKGDFPYMKERAWREALAFRPDVAVIKLGTNDTKPHNWQHGQDYERDMQQMIDSLRASNTGVKIYLCTPIPAFKSTWDISDSIITASIVPIINKVAKRNKCKVIDLHTLFAPYGKLMQGDGIHPNEKGARQIAELVRDALSRDY